MPRFEPFRAVRYNTAADLNAVIAPPYDVLSAADRHELGCRHPENIVHIDVPVETDGEGRYAAAGELYRRWLADRVLVSDDAPSFTLYRMQFVDVSGRERNIVGVLGALEVVDTGAGRVLPHERTTKKASTDRLDLTRATLANLSPVWGLSLATGLTSLLTEPGDPVGSLTVLDCLHSVERVTDPVRVQAISAMVWSDDVLIADGHHRYGVARIYRDETRLATGSDETPAELTLTFISELVEDQLSVDAIHRVYRNITPTELRAALEVGFEIEDAGTVGGSTLADMQHRNALCLLDATGTAAWLTPRSGFFDGIRALDGAWLEHVLDGTAAEVDYQHGVVELRNLLEIDSSITAAVMIRPVSVAEIERTAREGLLMPPKSTFFTPKLRTGLVIRPLD